MILFYKLVLFFCPSIATDWLSDVCRRQHRLVSENCCRIGRRIRASCTTNHSSNMCPTTRLTLLSLFFGKMGMPVYSTARMKLSSCIDFAGFCRKRFNVVL